MELISEMSESGNMVKDKNTIGSMSNREQVMEHATEYGEKVQLMNGKCSTT
mgnify:FL=1